MTMTAELLVFAIKIILIVVAILVIVAGFFAIASKGKAKNKGHLHVDSMNESFEELTEELNDQVLNKKQRKLANKAAKKEKKSREENQKRIFVINFEGDIKASACEALREEITAILSIATPDDEVVAKIMSPGGVVHGYGLAASQLARLKTRNIPLTIAIDKVAASGGYMMACVGNKVIAAPFAIIGSIGAVMQIPNFHRFLKKHNIDFEQMTAGEFKRTLSLFGENTDKGRAKAQEELEDVHKLFKEFITTHRPQVDINEVATGEHWFGTRAKELLLVDELMTSDDYLFNARKTANLFQVTYKIKQSLGSKISNKVSTLLGA